MNLWLMPLILLGLTLGSFINALVWRLHQKSELRRQISDVRKNKKSKDAKASALDAQRSTLSVVHGRSMCPNCRHVLAWYDLVPVFSWLALKGRCRYCQKPISGQYPLVEITTAILVVVSYITWPFALQNFTDYGLFCVWLALLTLLIALAFYDIKWMLLPNRLVYPLLAAAAVFLLFTALQTSSFRVIWSGLAGTLIGGGFFWLIYQISAGKWIGGGDVRLGFALGLLLGWQKTILALTLAAYLGLGVIIIIALLGKYKKRMKLPFGPLLIAASYISLLWGQHAIDIYKRWSGLD